jgi:hypothetical protein
MTGDDPAVPAVKRQKYVAFSLSEKIWLLDYGKKHPKVNSDDCGKALAAEVNANVPEHEKRKAPGKNTVNGLKLLPHNDVIMSANEFHELDGEREVFEELDDAAILQMIQSDNAADVVDSDKDEADDFVDVTTTKAQTLQLASDLHEFALAQPQLFHASDVAALQNMRTALDKSIMHSRKQLTLTDLFADRRGS